MDSKELKELAEFCYELAHSWTLLLNGNEREQLRRLHDLLTKLAEEELGK